MENPHSDRVLALAGLAQSLQQVRRIAETGHSDTGSAQPVLGGVFRNDAPSAAAGEGGVPALAPGRRRRAAYLSNRAAEPLLPRGAVATVQLERRFSSEPATLQAVANGLAGIAPRAQELGSTHPEVLAALGSLYA